MMDIFFYTVLFVFGTLLGSFSSVIIHRLKSGESGIWTGRSHCPKCDHTLHSIDLFPIFSWLSTLGKCRYCKVKIPKIYPILEISTGILFSLIGFFLIDFNLILNGGLDEIFKLIFWLSIGFISIIYIFYDILFLEIHEGIMFSGVFLTFIGLIIQTFTNINLFNTLNFGNIELNIGIYSVILGILIIGLFYLILLKEFKEYIDALILLIIVGLLIGFKYLFGIELSDFPILSGLVGAVAIFIFFFLQIVLSGGKALGGGDLRIAIMIGLALGISYSFAGMMATYMIGSIIGVGLIIGSRMKSLEGKINTQVPFGPFLAVGFFVVIFFQENIDKLLNIYL